MKKLFAVALLLTLNLYTMEYFKAEAKPYAYKLIKSIDTKKQNRTHQPGCFTGLTRAISRVITAQKNYLNK